MEIEQSVEKLDMEIELCPGVQATARPCTHEHIKQAVLERGASRKRGASASQMGPVHTFWQGCGCGNGGGENENEEGQGESSCEDSERGDGERRGGQSGWLANFYEVGA